MEQEAGAVNAPLVTVWFTPRQLPNMGGAIVAMFRTSMIVSGTTSSSSTAASPVSQWRTARLLYPTYAALVQRLGLHLPLPQNALELGEAFDPESLIEISRWVAEVDRQVQPHHLRQFLQESELASCEDALHALISHLLAKEDKSEADRDKLDYLLVQYFTASAPPSFQDSAVTREAVAEVLEPVLGNVPSDLPDWLEALDELLERLERCETLGEMWDLGLIRQGRELKQTAGLRYFEPKSLVAFTHLNSVLRREVARVMNSDLEFLGESLDKLQARGVQNIDCRAAGFSESESIASLKEKWASWEVPIDAPYTAESLFLPLIALRKVLEDAWQQLRGTELHDVCQQLAWLRKSAVSLTGQMEKVSSELRRQTALFPGPSSFAAACDQLPPDVQATDSELPSMMTETPADQALVSEDTPAESDAHNPGEEVIPAASVEEPTPAPAEPAILFDLEERMTKVKGSLVTTVRRKSAISLAVGGTRVLLTPSEVGAFFERDDEVALAIRRAVTLRLALVEALEAYKQDRQTGMLVLLVKHSRAEYEQAQALISKCRSARREEPAESIAATSRQPMAMLQRGEKIAS